MKWPDILAKIQGTPEGATVFAENRYDQRYVETVFNTYRGKYIRMNYQLNKRIHPSCYQKFYPEYNPYAQPKNGCFATFAIPNIIAIDEHGDGLRYVGTDEFVTGKTMNFRRVPSRGWLSTYNYHPVMTTKNSSWIGFLYDASSGIIELYGNGATITNPPLVDAIFANPFDVPTYNKTLDQYPINDDAIPEIEKMIFMDNTRIAEATHPTPAFTTNPLQK